MKRCGAKNRQGGKCKRAGTGAGGRCNLHGGKTPSGPASPNWKHGNRSRWGLLPKGLAEHYARTHALADRELLALTDDLALVEAQIAELLTNAAKRGKPLTEKEAGTLERRMEQRRRLVESETRRRKETQETLSIQQGMALVSMVAAAVNEIVTNLQERASLTRRLQAMLRAPREESTLGTDDARDQRATLAPAE